MPEPIATVSTLGTFIAEHREELIRRCLGLVANRPAALTDGEVERGIPLLLDRLVTALGHEPSKTRAFWQTRLSTDRPCSFRALRSRRWSTTTALSVRP